MSNEQQNDTIVEVETVETRHALSLQPALRFPEFQDSGDWEYITLGEYGDTLSGLSGKSGADFGSGKPYVTYMQVFNNAIIDVNQCGRVIIGEKEKQNKLEKGDVLITTSSETPNEVGFASVMLEHPKEDIYLNSFCFVFRPNHLIVFSPSFFKLLIP